MLKRIDGTISEKEFMQGKTLYCVREIWDDKEVSMFLPNMRHALVFKTFNGEDVNFYVSEEEYLKLLTVDFYDITKDMALQAQKNTIAQSINDQRTSMSDYLNWVKAVNLLEEALKEEKSTIEAYFGKSKND